ncbi:hypothetical protein ACROYT_G024707 [Oculina patagonica]
MRKELAIVVAALMLMQLVTHTNSCGPVCIKYQKVVIQDNNGNVCKLIKVVQIKLQIFPIGKKRRRRDVVSAPSPSSTTVPTVSSTTATPSCPPPTEAPPPCLHINGTDIFTQNNFNHLDSNGDGFISFAEFSQVSQVELIMD